MVPVWIIVGLVVATISVSVLGAGFSVLGLAALFSGAAVAVLVMASSLEFAKFVLTAYVHQRWSQLNVLFRSYLLFAIVTLSLITSMGIFGFLSNAYQSASNTLEAETIKLESLKRQQASLNAEKGRIQKGIDDIPANQSTKRFKARAEAAPLFAELNQGLEDIEKQVTAANLEILAVKEKVGPLIYIARSFKTDLDDVVKYLILILVCVFDPLAICLVIAVNDSLDARRRAKKQEEFDKAYYANNPPPVTPSTPAETENVIEMSFADEDDKNAV